MAMLVSSSLAFAQGTAVLTGTVTDAATNKPVADVVVTATSPSLQGEEIVVTDATGLYRIPQLPPGAYTLRLERESFKPFSRGDITLRSDRTIRLNVQLQPESVQAEEVVVVGKAPTVDIGSTATGITVGKEFINNVPFVQPNVTGTRSFESVAAVAPQVVSDQFGYGINGTTSPENGVLIDGISVTDPAYGGTNRATGIRDATMPSVSLPVDFVEEVNVVTGGYMPEYGRSTGGIINAILKSGGNEFHGSVFGDWTPGALRGPRPEIETEASTYTTKRELWNSGDFGVELGGPILKDRLWFFVGFSPSFARERLTQTINQFRFNKDAAGNLLATDPDGNEVLASDMVCQPAPGRTVSSCRLVFDPSRDSTLADANGNQLADAVPGTTDHRFLDSRAYTYVGKLTLLLTPNQNLALSVSGASMSANTPNFRELQIAGVKDSVDTLDVSLKYTAGFFDKHLLVDATVGWHHQNTSALPDDGSRIGSTTGAASVSGVILRKSNPIGWGVRELEHLPTAADGYCDIRYPELCPSTSASNTYNIGGAFYMEESQIDRLQAKVGITYLLQALGHHVFKGGLDLARSMYNIKKGYGGGNLLRDSTSGGSYRDYRRYAYLTGPDELVSQDPNPGVVSTPAGTEIGAYLQDSWSIFDKVTLNLGFRYDQQYLFGGDGSLGMSLNNMWSPRLGVVYDFTQRGQSKVFASYARYYESVPLDLADRALTGENQAGFVRTTAASAARRGCQPVPNTKQANDECLDPNNYQAVGGDAEPSQTAYVTGHGKAPVDPALQPQSSDEILVGAEYELIQDGRVGVSYTKRWLNAAIEDMSRDEANTYFVGNPGYGIAKDFPKATRDYDAVTVYFSKAFSDLWQAQVSYTWSYLRGNYAGLFRPETNQLDPNINSDFDLISLLPNRTGPLPGDRTHYIKAFAAKEFVLTGNFSLTLGLAYNGKSGQPLSYLASHPLYGEDESFVLPRGAAGRGPWIHTIDAKLAAQLKINKDNAVQLSVDVFNLFNFAAASAQDQTFSTSDILPYIADPSSTKTPQQAACLSGNDPNCVPQLRVFNSDTNQAEAANSSLYNPNFKRATQYQPPLTVRFGIKVTF
ncbi:MAG: TonB-dependent receptor [Archangiaceae bacterium]|nr:TonB-dependent receptor [Archangiaceae bacterium]